MNRELTLVTGAGGYVGGAVVKELLSQGVNVRAMIRRREQAQALSAMGVEVAVADLLDEQAVRTAVSGCSRVVHIAALFRQGGVSAKRFSEVNVTGTQILLDASIAAGVSRFIHCSTVGVHGHIEFPPANEESPFNPGDFYQRTKLDGERLVRSYFERGDLHGAVIRPAMVYGPHDVRTMKLFKMLANGTFVYVGSGDALVHFVDVRDLARSFFLALQNEELKNEVFIVAGETSLRLKEMNNLISTLMGVRPPSLHLPVRLMQELGSICEAICTPLGIEPPIFRRRVDFFTKNRSFDCTKARKILEFTPAQSLVGELLNIIESYIADNSIAESSVKLPSVLTRTIEGEIDLWDKRAEASYGFSSSHALGSVSHQLLETLFPDDLAKINSFLLEKGLWHGELSHSRRNGKRVAVASTWQVLPRMAKPPLIVEVNRFVTDRKVRQGWSDLFSRTMGSLVSSIPTIEELAPILGCAVRART